jgi:hypothetical protein
MSLREILEATYPGNVFAQDAVEHGTVLGILTTEDVVNGVGAGTFDACCQAYKRHVAEQGESYLAEFFCGVPVTEMTTGEIYA